MKVWIERRTRRDGLSDDYFVHFSPPEEKVRSVYSDSVWKGHNPCGICSAWLRNFLGASVVDGMDCNDLLEVEFNVTDTYVWR